MTIKILGSGCKYCETLAKNVKKALADEVIEADLVKVTDFGEIAKYGVMSTPALVIDEKVVSAGRVLKPKEIAKLIKA